MLQDYCHGLPQFGRIPALWERYACIGKCRLTRDAPWKRFIVSRDRVSNDPVRLYGAPSKGDTHGRKLHFRPRGESSYDTAEQRSSNAAALDLVMEARARMVPLLAQRVRQAILASIAKARARIASAALRNAATPFAWPLLVRDRGVASEGFIPPWTAGSTLRYRFNPR